jgi:hypothetical protein
MRRSQAVPEASKPAAAAYDSYLRPARTLHGLRSARAALTSGRRHAQLGTSSDVAAPSRWPGCVSHLQFSQIRGRQPYLIVRKILYVIEITTAPLSRDGVLAYFELIGRRLTRQGRQNKPSASAPVP